MSSLFAHVDGETVMRATPRQGDNTGLAETLDSWLAPPPAVHERWKGALDRQRAVAIAKREMDRKRAILSRQSLAADLRLDQREERLRETGHGVITAEKDLERREAAAAQREKELRSNEQLHSELLRTATQLREAHARAEELARVEVELTQRVQRLEAEVREAGEMLEWKEREVEREAAERQKAQSNAEDHRKLRVEAEARARQAEASRAEAGSLLAQAAQKQGEAQARVTALEQEATSHAAEVAEARKEVRRVELLGELKAQGAARLSEAATASAFKDREEAAWKAEAEVPHPGPRYSPLPLATHPFPSLQPPSPRHLARPGAAAARRLVAARSGGGTNMENI